jgi:uncharacterized membrane protein HdeD (DUF308 family)
MFKTHNLLNIGFPIYLTLFEWLLRTLSSVDTSSFIGPTLATSGIGLLVSSLKPKKIELDPVTVQTLQNQGITAIVRDKKDERLITICLAALFMELLGWYWSCSLTIKTGDNPQYFNYLPLIIGIFNFLIGIILSTLKSDD